MTIGPGGRHVVPPPAAAAPAVSLLTAAEIVAPTPDLGYDVRTFTDPTTGEIRTEVAEHWLNGITYEPEACTGGAPLFMGCVHAQAPPAQTKTIDANAAVETTDPFVVYAGRTCTTLDWESADYVPRARRLLERMESRLVENELWTGTAAQAGTAAGPAYATDQWLAGAGATVLSGGASAAPSTAWAAILDYLAANGSGPAFIHVPAPLLPSLQRTNLVRRDGGRYLDGMDNVVVPGYGYPGTSAAGVAPSTGAVWVFVSSPVRIWRGDVMIVPDTYAEALTRSAQNSFLNSFTFVAERAYLVDWDRCVWAAQEIQFCDGCA